mmetsp:Transcript_34928/g.92888  ORF Transcript_34928/g.92888 Transcript_34928/m.92888 type:complete len:205 (+) Transcript_34928:84-698(+)
MSGSCAGRKPLDGSARSSGKLLLFSTPPIGLLSSLKVRKRLGLRISNSSLLCRCQMSRSSLFLGFKSGYLQLILRQPSKMPPQVSHTRLRNSKKFNSSVSLMNPCIEAATMFPPSPAGSTKSFRTVYTHFSAAAMANTPVVTALEYTKEPNCLMPAFLSKTWEVLGSISSVTTFTFLEPLALLRRPRNEITVVKFRESTASGAS